MRPEPFDKLRTALVEGLSPQLLRIRPAAKPTAVVSSARPVALRTAMSAGPVPPDTTVRTAGISRTKPPNPKSAHQLVSRATMMINKALRLSKIR